MGKTYDDWERLVVAVLRRQQLRELTMCPSITTGSSSSFCSSSSFHMDESFGPDPEYQELISSSQILVHAQMCSELLKLVTDVSKLVPEIEASRPRCYGMEALCLLNNGLVKAKSIIQYCAESSTLYSVLTGETILLEGKKSRDLIEQILGNIQKVVPVLLAEKISRSLADLRNASFCLDPLEEEAGKLLRDLLQNYGSTIDFKEELALYAIQSVSSLLHITSPKAILIEKRSIKKLLDRIPESELNKRKVLSFFLNLLIKYGNFLTEEEMNSKLAVKGSLLIFSDQHVKFVRILSS